VIRSVFYWREDMLNKPEKRSKRKPEEVQQLRERVRTLRESGKAIADIALKLRISERYVKDLIGE